MNIVYFEILSALQKAPSVNVVTANCSDQRLQLGDHKYGNVGEIVVDVKVPRRKRMRNPFQTTPPSELDHVRNYLNSKVVYLAFTPSENVVAFHGREYRSSPKLDVILITTDPKYFAKLPRAEA